MPTSSAAGVPYPGTMSPSTITEDDITAALSNVLLSDVNDGLDSDLISYLAGMLSEGLSPTELAISGEDSPVMTSVGPFLESSGCSNELIERACKAVNDLAKTRVPPTASGSTNNGGGHAGTMQSDSDATAGARRLRQGMVSMASDLTNTSEHEMDNNRFLWGTDGGVSAITNKTVGAYETTESARDRRKARQELEKARREYESKMKAMEAEEENAVGGKGGAAVSSMVLPDYRSGRNERDVQVRNVSLSLDNGRPLLDNAELKFAYRRRYGLVGKNGIGKTTLLKAIASMEVEGFPRHLRVLHVRQEMRPAGGDISVLQAVLEADVERNTLLAEEKELLQRLEGNQGDGGNTDDEPPTQESVAKRREQLRAKRESMHKSDPKNSNNSGGGNGNTFDADLKRLDEVYARLNILASDAAESRAATILSGLQFTPEMQAGPTSALSGGWRMRVSLAAALFVEPDLLMLDEPTNHLDLEAVLWLESYLVEYKHTLVVVSHDRGFLNEVCSDIIQFKDLKLTYYRGNYDTYVKTSDENVKNAMRVYQAYQDKRAHMMEFIEKFRCNAKRASLVQSRIKAVEKMDAEAPEPVEVEPLWRFSIPNPAPLGRPIISVDNATFDYNPVDASGQKKPESDYLLQKVDFGVDLDSRIGILGANGAGKSTLLNLIMDRIQPTSGMISRNPHLRIGHFTQHSADKFDLHLSSIENMLALFEEAGDQEMRSFLGRFQIQGTDALKPMLMLSGGQKSRVAFAALAYQKPHVIIMDEPTNHLDMESIDALVEAIKDFRGGLIVVSHDQFFITNTCSELWVVGEGKVTRFRGDFNDYKKHTLEKTAKRVAESVKSLSTINN